MEEWERFVQAARAAGCPADQLRNFVSAGYVPQAKQLRFHALARAADRPGGPSQIGYGGARGGGKSHCVLAQVGVDDCQRYPGLKCLLLRRVGKAVRESFEDLRAKTLLGIPHKWRKQEASLTFENGSRIILGHFQNESDIDSYLGLEYDLIAVEEATTLSSSKYRSILTCLRTSKAGWRPRMYSTTNPGGVGHAWYKATFIAPYKAGCEGDTRFIPATVDDNAFVNPEYRKTLDSLTGWQKRAWRWGDWDIAAGQFFTTWREDVVAPIGSEPKDLRRVWASLDYGFTHYTVAYLMGEDYRGDVWIVDEHAERRWTVERQAEAIRAMLDRHGVGLHQLEAFVAGRDVFSTQRDGGTVADDYARCGVLLSPANDDRVQGAAEMLRRLGDVDAGVRPSLHVSARCGRLIECIPALEHNPHRAEDVLKVDTDDDGVGGDDAYDAARYGLMVAAGMRPAYGANPLAGYRG